MGSHSPDEDPLVFALGEWLDRCGDELGIPGCTVCPVTTACKVLWRNIENHINHNLTFPEFRQYSQKFNILKGQRNEILERRRKLPAGKLAYYALDHWDKYHCYAVDHSHTQGHYKEQSDNEVATLEVRIVPEYQLR